MSKITHVDARMIFDSRGVPTIEGEVILDGTFCGRFKAPSGASVGSLEAVELRDHDPKAYGGKGVRKAISLVHGVIAKALVGQEYGQKDLDQTLIALDGTPTKKNLGANTILAISGAFFHAHAHEAGRELYDCRPGVRDYLLPRPMINVLNGGVHANNGLDIQEFMIVPHGAPGFSEAMRWSAEVFYELKNIIKDRGLSIAVGDEGGFAPTLACNEDALKLLVLAVEKAGYQCGKDFFFALDVAANEIFDGERNAYCVDNELISRTELAAWYCDLAKRYPICSIEDPFSEDDFLGFAELTKLLGTKMQIVGDDLFVTNVDRIRQGFEQKLANAVLIKMNQVGTITETLAAIELAQSVGFGCVISHRSGETEDTTIADLAVLTNAGQIKTGSLSRSERVAKYNRLLRIEKELGSMAQYAGMGELYGT